MPRTDRGALRALAVCVGFCLLAGIAAVGGLGLATIRAHLQASGPPASPSAAAAARTVATQEAARVGSAAADLLSSAHPDPAAAVAAWQRFAAAVANATTLAGPAAVASAADRQLAVAVSTARGRAAVAATESALDGRVLALPASSRTGMAAADRFQRAQPATAQLTVYYINGVLTPVSEATTDAALLQDTLGVPVKMIYDRSVLQVDDYSVDLCMRALVARYRDRAGVGDFGNTRMDRLITEADRDLQAAGDAALTVACRTADGVLSAANLAITKVKDVAVSSAELTAQWLTGTQFASVRVNSELVPLIEKNLTAGGRVIVIGHSQGTMFARRALQDVNTWWPHAFAGEQGGGCQPSASGTPTTPAPVGALYIAPAFWSDTSDGSDLNSGLQRYVALHGDVLGLTKIGWVTPTIEPISEQTSVIPGWTARELHRLTTYLMPQTPSRTQTEQRFLELQGALARMNPAPTPPSPTREQPRNNLPSCDWSGSPPWWALDVGTNCCRRP